MRADHGQACTSHTVSKNHSVSPAHQRTFCAWSAQCAVHGPEVPHSVHRALPLRTKYVLIDAVNCVQARPIDLTNVVILDFKMLFIVATCYLAPGGAKCVGEEICAVHRSDTVAAAGREYRSPSLFLSYT